MATVAMAMALLEVLWPLMVLAKALFALHTFTQTFIIAVIASI